jgi:DNA-binding XRE family transcriptional regulator
MSNMERKGFVKNGIVKYRIMSRCSQKELADILGVPPRTLGRWERGVRMPSVYYAIGISVALHRLVDEIFGEYRREWIGTINERNAGVDYRAKGGQTVLKKNVNGKTI